MIAVNVSQLLKQPPGTAREFAFSDRLPELRPEIEILSPVEGRANLLRTARGILVSSRYQTTVRLECGRCLNAVDVGVRGESSDEFMPKVDVFSGHVLAEQPESDELAIDERHLLNLTEVIRQDLLTRLPLQPLCEAACPGLCPECGEDLRKHGADCGRAAVESSSPFAGLAELLKRSESTESLPD